MLLTVFCVLILFADCAQQNPKGNPANPSKGSISSPGAVSSFSPGGQYIMITFDDGPHSQLTPRLLDILKEKKIRVTFFVLGSKAINHPELLKRMVNEGHEVANHGWHHVVMSKISRPQLTQQLRQTATTVSDATKKSTVVMRPPFGNTNAQINEFIKSNESMTVVLWSLDSKDWETKEPTAVAKQIIDNAQPGDIILCHDIHPHTVDAMPQVIDKLQAKGYEFLTLSEVMSFPDDSPHRRRLRSR